MPLGKIYCYRDHRLDGMVDEVKARIDAARIYEITGIHFQPFNMSNQLLWFAEHRPSLLRKGVRFLPVPTLFTYYLGGVTAVDSTWASVTQLMDAASASGAREILDSARHPAAGHARDRGARDGRGQAAQAAGRIGGPEPRRS